MKMPMTHLEHIPEPLRPLWWPLLTTVALFVLSVMFFNLARDVQLAPAPDDLKVARVTIDEVVHASRLVADESRNRHSYVPASYATSKEWPGITFIFQGTGFSVEPPVTLNLYLDQDLAKLAAARQEMPSYSPVTRVYGITTDAGMVMNPADSYQSMLRKKDLLTLLARLSLMLAIMASAFLVWRARLIFN